MATALLILDIQAGTISRIPSQTQAKAYLSNLAKTIAIARSSPSVKKIIYATISFRPGHPEISPLAPAAFVSAAKAGMFVAGSPECQICDEVKPQEGDVVVEKKRVSAFSGSGLDVVLRGLGVEKLVLCGVSTGAVVLSTVCEAVDRDFEITVLKDLCMDRDEALHEMLMEKLFKKRGEVLLAEEWLERLEKEA